MPTITGKNFTVKLPYGPEEDEIGESYDPKAPAAAAPAPTIQGKNFTATIPVAPKGELKPLRGAPMVFGFELPETGFGKVTDLAIGFNDALAGALGWGLDAASPQTPAQKKFYASIAKDMDRGEVPSGKQTIQRAMKLAGIGADKEQALSDLAADMGEEVFNQGLIVASLMASAPYMAAVKGGSVTRNVVKEMGEYMMKRPGTVVASEIGSALGSEVGSTKGGPVVQKMGEAFGVSVPQELADQLGGIVGSFAGGGLGGGLATAGRPRAGGAGVPAQDFPEGGYFPRGGAKQLREAVPMTPLTNPNPDTGAISRATEGYKIKVQRAIDQALASVPKTGTPEVQANKLRSALRRSYETARSMETNLWTKTDLSRPVPTTGLKQFASNMMKQMGAESRPDALPMDIMARISKLPKKMSIKRMRDFRTIIMSRARDMGAGSNGPMPNDVLRRNLELLQGQIMDDITAAYPNDRSMAEAREFSTWLHNNFTRGPVSDFARAREMESALPGARGAAAKAIRTEGSGAASANIGQVTQNPEIEQAAGQFIQAQTREWAQQSGPEGAAKYLNSPEVKRYMEAFPKLEAGMTETGARLNRLLAEQDTINSSAFFREAGSTPQIAAERLLSTPNGKRAAAEVMRRVSRDPDAVAAIREQTINSLGASVKWNPVALQNRLASRDTRDTLVTILGSEQYARLNQMVKDGVGVATGGEPMFRKFARTVSVRSGNIIGAVFGRMLNTGTLQGPALGSQIGKNFVESLFKTLPPDMMLARAVADPRWERFLRSRIPGNLKELTRVSKEVRALVSGTEALADQTEE